MRPTATALTAFTPVAMGVPAAALHVLPVWAVLALIGVGVLLTATQVIVTQFIRLRASARITRSQDALRVLEIEDLPRHQPRLPQDAAGDPRVPRGAGPAAAPAADPAAKRGSRHR